MSFFKKHSPFINLLVFFLVVNIILRIVLLFHPITQSSFGVLEIGKIFLFGLFSDLFVFIVASALLWLYLLFLSNSKYNRPWGYIIFGCLLSLLIYVSFFNTILNEYGGSLPEIGISFIALKTFLFGLLLFLPKYRKQIRLVLYYIAIFIFVLIIVQNAISEFFFWNEFGARYNFIAVDYLVYTNTVIGNIMESYPVVPLFIGVGLITAFFTYYIVKNTKAFLYRLPSFTNKIKGLGIYLALFIISFFAIPFFSNQEKSTNVFTNELQADGLYKFYVAFMNNDLEYNKFYKTLPDAEAFAVYKKELPAPSKPNAAEIHKNVVLITVESFSADFMKAYGNKKNLTPFLDSLATKSLQFTNIYAVGNRTVRGLEAVTLCLPPSPAESVVKKKDNKNKFSTGSVFKQKGYQVKYLYGGDAFFDNMGDFFGGNGYEIVDKKSFTPNEITFANVWGVCDEDMYRKAIKVMNQEAQNNKPFFNHIMTVSNHRPFTYPEGKIDISGKAKSREGGVKYTDYALRQFFAMAEKQEWFRNTVFVIVADHCASSSGKTELPLEKYRIPALIYSPGFVAPGEFNKLMSQIDVMPTLFGLLHFNYNSKFYGQDVFKKDYEQRAFIATYQDLGLVEEDLLTVISPVKKVKQFALKVKPNPELKPEFQMNYEEKPLKKLNQELVYETIGFYQTTAYLLKNKKYQK
ncbi:LTA synthase family protein [Flavobacterium sp. AS60]|uniref:LTA synthase family protein n=1 Tax=Flavobacterium anseongense TaxID=2910677 RepID=UPI001F15A742|nr:LTA synthase family protein [Flavobacterium sp. AS60]MCF6128660.1 LTA synthase family protein [Flavobacterium sp. AS60]